MILLDSLINIALTDLESIAHTETRQHATSTSAHHCHTIGVAHAVAHGYSFPFSFKIGGSLEYEERLFPKALKPCILS
jgi:hypothetical protein